MTNSTVSRTLLNSGITSSSFWIWLMMHWVEEVSSHLQPIQVSTGPGLLAVGTLFSLTLTPCTLKVRKKRKKRKAATGACSVIAC